MPQERDRVVIDTNIIISAAISIDGTPAKIFNMFLEDKIINYTTPEIINEIEKVFRRPKIDRCITKGYKELIITNYIKKSINIKPQYFEKIVKEDPDDDKFINCALSSKVKIIITGDKHLLKVKKYQDIKIMNVHDFLKQLNID